MKLSANRQSRSRLTLGAVRRLRVGTSPFHSSPQSRHDGPHCCWSFYFLFGFGRALSQARPVGHCSLSRPPPETLLTQLSSDRRDWHAGPVTARQFGVLLTGPAACHLQNWWLPACRYRRPKGSRVRP